MSAESAGVLVADRDRCSFGSTCDDDGSGDNDGDNLTAKTTGTQKLCETDRKLRGAVYDGGVGVRGDY